MKRLIFLKLDISQLDEKLSLAKYLEAKKALIEPAIKQFKSEIKQIPQIKVLKDLLPEPQVIIEFPNNDYQTVYEALIKLPIVETVDVSLPKGEN
jgi:hypothetical protein